MNIFRAVMWCLTGFFFCWVNPLQMFISVSLEVYSDIHTINTAVKGKMYFIGPTLRISVWYLKKKKFLKTFVMLWRPHSCFTESGTACLFDGQLSEMSEEEFWLTVNRTEEPFLPFDVVYVVSRRGAGREQGEALLSSPLFYSPKQFGIFYFCHHSYQYKCTPISTPTKTTDMHAPCQSHNLPVQSNNY